MISVIKSRVFATLPQNSHALFGRSAVRICSTNADQCSDVKITEQKVKLNQKTLTKLERLAGLRFKNEKEISQLEEKIAFADRIFEVDTKDVEPLYSIVEELIDCPLREDNPKELDKNLVFKNSKAHIQGFFLTPQANVPLEENNVIKRHCCQMAKE